MELNTESSALIAGCGYVGKRLARRLYQQGFNVDALVSSEQSLTRLSQAGITAFRMDLDDHRCSKILSAYDVIYYLVPPNRNGTTDDRIRLFLKCIPETPKRVALFSTTGVYGDCKGAWVDENSIPAPGTDRAARRLDAEQTLKSWCEKRDVEYTILRIPGIYGPGKLPLDRIKSGTPVLRQDESPWSNRIHVDDLIQVCLMCLSEAGRNQIFNVSDGNPSSMTDYFFKIADIFGLHRPGEVTTQQASELFSREMMSYLAESRKISNRKMLDALKIHLLYPDLESGIRQCRQELEV